MGRRLEWKNSVKRRRGRSPTCALTCEQRAMGMQIQKLNLTVVLSYCKESNLPLNRIFFLAVTAAHRICLCVSILLKPISHLLLLVELL